MLASFARGKSPSTFAGKLTVLSLNQMSRHFGKKDHTTLLHGIQKIERLLQTDWTVAYDVAQLEQLI